MPRRVLVLVPPGGELNPLCDALQRSGLDVHRVKTEAELIAAAGDVAAPVLLDQALGDGVRDGTRILEATRAAHPHVAVVLVAETGDVERANAAIRAGAHDYLVRGDRLAERVATLIAKLRRQVELADENRRLRQASARSDHFVTRSPALLRLFEVVERIAHIPRPVLIVGERGTGKELVARALHERSGARGPFVAVNAAAFSDTLLDAELFGYEKGSFTGAEHRTPGKFELAHRGTLFLDEVANMSPAFQQKILRTIEYGTFRRVGGSEELHVSVRIVAATNADLKGMSAAGTFLSDLYDRLSFEVLRIPPLRERLEDVEPLAKHFLEQFAREVPNFADKRLSAEAIAMLRDYHFPGNARELKHIVERAAYRDRSDDLEPEDIGELPAPPERGLPGSFKERIETLERELISDALRAEKDNQRAAAKRLGLAYHQFRYTEKSTSFDPTKWMNGSIFEAQCHRGRRCANASLARMSNACALARAEFGEHFHACAFVMGQEEERAVIDPFLVEGMSRGEKAVYIVDPVKRGEHESRLAASAPSADMLEVTTWNDAHLKGGSFDQDRMMLALEEMIREHGATGRPPMRLVGQMGWVFSKPPGIEQLVAYEASVNDVLNRGKTPTVCVYDVRRLSGSMMMDLLRAHPLTVMNGVLHENPFYTPANEMLRDIQQRRTPPS